MMRQPDMFTNSRFEFDTDHEIEFLRNLGKQAPKKRDEPGHSRQILLKRYHNSMRLRHDWGNIDPGIIEAVVEESMLPS